MQQQNDVAQPSTRSGAARSAGSRPLLVTGAVAGLAVAAVCLHAGGSAPYGDIGPLHGAWLLIALVCAFAGWAGITKYRVRQDERPMGTPREMRTVTLTTAVLALTTLGTCAVLIPLGTGHDTTPYSPPSGEEPPPVHVQPGQIVKALPSAPPKQTTVHPFPLADLLIWLLAVAVALVLVLLAVRIVRWLRSRAAPPVAVGTAPPVELDAAVLTEAVGAGRLALRGEDVRAAVIACYAAMEDSLAASGVGRQRADSPSDLLDRATRAGLLVGLAPQQLAGLFREARYSSHPMGDAELRRARHALDDISRLLAERAVAAAAAAADGAPGDAVQADGLPVGTEVISG